MGKINKNDSKFTNSRGLDIRLHYLGPDIVLYYWFDPNEDPRDIWNDKLDPETNKQFNEQTCLKRYGETCVSRKYWDDNMRAVK
jgi:hypothetical protein